MTTATATPSRTREVIEAAYPGAVFLTLEQAADLLQTSVPAVREHIVRGSIPATKLGARGWRVFVPGLVDVLDAGFTHTN